MEMKKRVKDLTGVVFGDLTVNRYHGIRTFNGKSNSALWHCSCACGEDIILTRKQLHAPSMTMYKWGSPNCKHRCERNYDMAAKGETYRRYRRGAVRRDLSFNMELDYFIEIVSSACHYCGTKPTRVVRSGSGLGTFVCNGVDRVNNEIGYESWNVVPCCTNCNTAKGTQTYNDFVNWIERLKIHDIPKR